MPLDIHAFQGLADGGFLHEALEGLVLRHGELDLREQVIRLVLFLFAGALVGEDGTGFLEQFGD